MRVNKNFYKEGNGKEKIMDVEKDKIFYTFSHRKTVDPISCVCDVKSKGTPQEGCW